MAAPSSNQQTPADHSVTVKSQQKPPVSQAQQSAAYNTQRTATSNDNNYTKAAPEGDLIQMDNSMHPVQQVQANYAQQQYVTQQQLQYQVCIFQNNQFILAGD